MTISNARGSIDQIRQLAGMRGLMAKPSGKIIETPIKANFREGLKVLEYFSSTHGARKGLADTALKTADSGYLTRKLVDVAQNVTICEEDCGTLNGITKSPVYRGDKVEVPLAKLITARVARDNIVNLITDEVIVRENEVVSETQARRIEELGYTKVRVRSPMTCESPMGICRKCYGNDLSTGKLVEQGLAAGIMAAQSIGEPGTQLTMRTFHIGGTAFRRVERPEMRARQTGTARFTNLNVVANPQGEAVALSRNGEIVIVDEKDREIERHQVPAGAVVTVKDGEKAKAGLLLCRWDAHMIPILVDINGTVRFEDLVEGKTMREETDANTGVKRKVVIEHKGDLHPQIIIEDRTGKILGLYPVPEKAHIEVDEGEDVKPGTLLAKTPREITGTQDITGGLPRVTELFEARKPKEPAIISEIDGVVELGEKRRGKRTIIVKNESGQQVEHLVPIGKHLRVHRGDRVKAGEALVEGPLILQDILRINGEEALQIYLLREVQNVYRSQNVTIDDKHVETIITQMLRKVRIDEPGETDFLPGDVVDKFKFRRTNQQAEAEGKKPAAAKPLLLGLTKASLQSESFIAAASFQETTRVLTEAALAGRVDHLLGLKENVILGHLIPAGTAFRAHQNIEIRKHVLPEEVVAGVEALPETAQEANPVDPSAEGSSSDHPASTPDNR
jgi:DNA-directed RNA polymerase subunit beta'